MSLVYRAIWQDNGVDDICGLAADTFAQWVTGKWPSLTVPANGATQGHGEQRGEHVDLEVRAVAAEEPGVAITQAYRADLIETRDSGARWHTILCGWAATHDDGATNRWLWVDVEVVGDVDVPRLAPAAPKLVRELLSAGVLPQVDGDALVPDHPTIAGSAQGELLAEVISRVDRTLPISSPTTARVRGLRQRSTACPIPKSLTRFAERPPGSPLSTQSTTVRRTGSLPLWAARTGLGRRHARLPA